MRDRLRHVPHARIVLSIVPLVALAGFGAWWLMPRQEDPSFPARYGAVVVTFAGAQAEDMERLVVEPIEEQLAQVEELKLVTSTSRADVALFQLELREDIYDTHFAWDEVREALDKVEGELPEDASAPILHDDAVQLEGMIFAVTGSTDPLELRHAARKLRSALLRVPGVARVNLGSDPGEQVTIEFDEAAARRLGINQRLLSAQLAGRNAAIPGGAIRVGNMRAALSPEADFASIEEIERTPIILPSGASVELGEIARVRHGPTEPASLRLRHNGRMAISVGVIAQNEQHLINLGADVRSVLDRVQREIDPLRIEDISFQPTYVRNRLSNLGISLLLSVLIVAGVLFVSMGRRSALVVAAMVPVVALGTLAMFWVGGGVLQQMSIAAFVIALGMLVDNAIVMVESIQAGLDRGDSPQDAATNAVRQLRIPLSVATATTVAAFLPMLLAPGTTADFIRAVPVVITLALILSLFVALLVTPTFCTILLRPSAQGEGAFGGIGQELGHLGTRRPKLVLVTAALITGVALIGLLAVEQRFFPAADRNQLVVELRLREGSHLEETDRAVRKVEQMLGSRDEVTAITAFVGQGTPRFYYNVGGTNGAHVAQILVTTRGPADNEPLALAVRGYLSENVPEIHTTVQPLAQGPHVLAPVEVRLYGRDMSKVARVAERVLLHLKEIDGAVDARSDVDLGAPAIRVGVVDASAGRRGIARSDVALALLGQSRGLDIGEFRAGDTTVPIFLRSSAGENTRTDSLAALGVPAPGGDLVPLGQVANQSVEWRPAVIDRRNGRRITRVMSGLAADAPYSVVLDQLMERMGGEEIPEGVEVVFGGMAEGASDANTAMLRVLPVGILIILVCLLWEFRSFRRVGIVMASVPLCAVGVVPGLLIANQPFGFMSMLGVVALAGIVVNNAIVLLDVVEKERRRGATVVDALAESVRVRTRPIVLTTATTVAGLLPLALGSSTLWPPLAWSMISGLVSSTFLTLLVTPALYRVLIRDDVDESRRIPLMDDGEDEDEGPTHADGRAWSVINGDRKRPLPPTAARIPSEVPIPIHPLPKG